MVLRPVTCVFLDRDASLVLEIVESDTACTSDSLSGSTFPAIQCGTKDETPAYAHQSTGLHAVASQQFLTVKGVSSQDKKISRANP